VYTTKGAPLHLVDPKHIQRSVARLAKGKKEKTYASTTTQWSPIRHRPSAPPLNIGETACSQPKEPALSRTILVPSTNVFHANRASHPIDENLAPGFGDDSDGVSETDAAVVVGWGT
jgi:hypothetical protein